MKTIVLAFRWLLALTSQAQDATYSSSLEARGSGRMVRETKLVAPFTEIQTQQFPANITVEVGGSESSVAINLDDNLRPYLRIDQQNDILKLSFTDSLGKPFWISQSTMSVTIRTPQLIDFRHGSNSDVLIQGLRGKWFDLAHEANGRVMLRGKVTSFNVVSTANGNVGADELLTQRANVVSTARATVRVNAQDIKEINSGQGQIINIARGAK